MASSSPVLSYRRAGAPACVTVRVCMPVRLAALIYFCRLLLGLVPHRVAVSLFSGLLRLLCPPISSITNKPPIFLQLFKGQKSLAAQRKNAFFFPKKAFCCLFRFHRLSSAYCPLYTKNSHRAICNHRYTVDRSACASVTACRHTAPAILCVVLLRSV